MRFRLLYAFHCSLSSFAEMYPNIFSLQREKLLLLLGENDLVNSHMMVYISEFLVSSCIDHLFSEEERTSAINSVRSDVTQAGLAYTKDVAWSFFLKYVSFNAQIFVLIILYCNLFLSLKLHSNHNAII